MHIYYLAAAAANCTTGSWQQKWDCGWNQPTTGAAHAGYFTGHNVVPVLVGLVIVLLAVRAVRKRRNRASASAGTARVAARR